MTFRSIEWTITGIPQLPHEPTTWPIPQVVDIAQLIHDLVHLPSEAIGHHAARAGIELMVIQWESLPWYEETELSFETCWPLERQAPESLRLFDLIRIFERHIWFLHELSPHAVSQRNASLQYQKYSEHLHDVGALLSPLYRLKIQNFRYYKSATRETYIRTLEWNGLSPAQVMDEILLYGGVDRQSKISLGTILAHCWLSSYKKVFEGYMRLWVSFPISQKPDVTNQELQDYIRKEFSQALLLLWKYLNQQEVWQYIEKKYGREKMKKFFQEYESLENGYMEGIARRELRDLKPLSFTLFYQKYRDLVDMLYDLQIIPQIISLDGLERSL